MRKLLCFALATTFVTGFAVMAKPVPALAQSDSAGEINELKAEVSRLSARIDELERQQTSATDLEQAKQANRFEPSAGTEAWQTSTRTQAPSWTGAIVSGNSGGARGRSAADWEQAQQLNQYEPAADYTHQTAAEPMSGAQAHDWSGPYIGANIGAGMVSGNVEDRGCFSCASDSFAEAFLQGGVHAGYNHQFGTMVLGGEMEFNEGSQSHEGELGDWTTNQWNQHTRSEIRESAAVLGRAGLAAGNAMFFMDAGPAIAHLKGSSITGSGATSWHVDSWVPGIKGGVGAEFMFSPHMSVRAQYSILDIAGRKARAEPASTCNGGNGVCSDGWMNMQQTATVGADYHF